MVTRYNRTLQDAIAYGKDVLHQTNNQFTTISMIKSKNQLTTSSGVNLTWGVREPIMLSHHVVPFIHPLYTPLWPHMHLSTTRLYMYLKRILTPS